MVDQVTYSHLLQVAQITNKSVEDVAKERGISSSELADMKLREAKFGGDPGDNTDVARFENAKSYIIVLPDGFKFVVKSINDFSSNSAQIAELEPGINEQLKEHGYYPPSLKNGVLTLETINGGKAFKTILNEEIAALTGEDGSVRIDEVTVTGSKEAAQKRKFVNTFGNAVANNTDMSAGQFTNVYNSMSEKFANMSDEDKKKTIAAVNEYMEAVKNGDSEKQAEVSRTILTSFGSPDGWLDPSNGTVIAAGVVLVAAVAAVAIFAPEAIPAMLASADISGSTLATTAALVATAALATSCTEENYDLSTKVDQKAEVKVNIPEQKQIDYTNILTELLNHVISLEGKVDEGNTNYSKQLQTIIDNLVKLMKQQDTNAAEYQIQFNTIIAWLETINADQNVSIEIQDNTYKTIQDLYKLINDTSLSAAEKLDKLMQILKNIEINTASILDKLTELVGLTKEESDKLDVIINQNEEANALVKAIYSAIERLGSEFRAYFRAILVGIAEGNSNIKALQELLKTINANIDKLNTTYKTQTERILSMLCAMNNNMVAGLTAILDAVLSGNRNILGKLDQLLNVAQNLYDKFTEHDEKTDNMLNLIYAVLANIAEEVSNLDLSKLQEMLMQIIKNGEITNAQIADMTKLLQTINNNVILNGQKQQQILEAIGKLGVDIAGKLNTIIAKLGNNEAKLDALLKLLAEMDANNEARTQAILEAIEKLDGNVAEGMTKILIAINNHPNNKDYSEVLNAILNKLGDIDKNNKTGFEAVVEIVGNLMGKDNVDLTQILAKLQEILEAIKNHEVTVHVTVDGKFTVCDEDGNVIHEGELNGDGLDWVLG